MVARRNLFLAWLAVTLTALAPVFAYGHIHVGANGELTEHCAADEPGDADGQQHSSKPDKGTAPHCPYCPGFSAAAPLALGGFGPVLHGPPSAPLVRAPHDVPSGRASVRIAQQRAPPPIS